MQRSTLCLLVLWSFSLYSAESLVIDEWAQKQRELFLEIKKTHPSMVKIEELLRSHSDLVNAYANGWTPLLYACKHEKYAICDSLLQKGAEVNATITGTSITPIVLACSTANEKISLLLLSQATCSAAGRDHHEMTALHHAATHGMQRVCEQLVAKPDAPLHALTKHDKSALHIAAQGGNVQLVRLFLEKGVSVNQKTSKGFTPLHYAAQHKHTSLSKLILSYHSSVNERDILGRTPLHYAVIMHALDVCRLLLEEGAEVDAQDDAGNTPLYFAATDGSVTVAELLLEYTCDVNRASKKGSLPFDIALYKGYESFCHLLLRKRNFLIFVAPSEKEFGTFHWLLSTASEELCEAALQKIDDAKLLTFEGESALHIAIKRDFRSVVGLLIEKGISLGSTGLLDDSALHLAAKLGRPELCKELVARGAELEAQDAFGRSPLHNAIEAKKDETARILIELGASICSENSHGATPLHFAAEVGSIDIVKLLLERGADPQHKDKLYEKPIQKAIAKNHLAIITLLCENSTAPSGEDDESSDDDTPIIVRTRQVKEPIENLPVSTLFPPQTPLCTKLYRAAVYRRDLATIKKHLADGAALDSQGYEGNTALHLLAAQGRTEECIELLRAGACPYIRNDRGHTSLGNAAKENKEETLHAMLEIISADQTQENTERLQQALQEIMQQTQRIDTIGKMLVQYQQELLVRTSEDRTESDQPASLLSKITFERGMIGVITCLALFVVIKNVVKQAGPDHT